MVGEAVRGSVVARLFGRMMGIGLAIGDVTATNSVYEEQGLHGHLTGLYGHATCLPASSAQALKQPAGNCYLFGATSDISWNKVSQG
jgi:hypothetical protein